MHTAGHKISRHVAVWSNPDTVAAILTSFAPFIERRITCGRTYGSYGKELLLHTVERGPFLGHHHIPDASSQLSVFERSPYHIINVGIQVVIERTKREHCTSSLLRVRLKTVRSLAYPDKRIVHRSPDSSV